MYKHVTLPLYKQFWVKVVKIIFDIIYKKSKHSLLIGLLVRAASEIIEG